MADEAPNNTFEPDSGLKFLSLEKKGRKPKKIRKSKPVNFIRRAGGLKAEKNLK